MAGLVPATHDLKSLTNRQSWMTGTRPTMTSRIVTLALKSRNPQLPAAIQLRFRTRYPRRSHRIGPALWAGMRGRRGTLDWTVILVIVLSRRRYRRTVADDRLL